MWRYALFEATFPSPFLTHCPPSPVSLLCEGEGEERAHETETIIFLAQWALVSTAGRLTGRPQRTGDDLSRPLLIWYPIYMCKLLSIVCRVVSALYKVLLGWSTNKRSVPCRNIQGTSKLQLICLVCMRQDTTDSTVHWSFEWYDNVMLVPIYVCCHRNLH